MTESPMYSLQLRLVKGLAGDPAGQKVELIALPEGTGEPREAHFELWEPLSNRLSAVASHTPFHLKAIYRTLLAGLTAPLIDRATGAPLFFSIHQLKDLGLAN
jgi:DNA mismatch repair protein MutH